MLVYSLPHIRVQTHNKYLLCHNSALTSLNCFTGLFIVVSFILFAYSLTHWFTHIGFLISDWSCRETYSFWFPYSCCFTQLHWLTHFFILVSSRILIYSRILAYLLILVYSLAHGYSLTHLSLFTHVDLPVYSSWFICHLILAYSSWVLPSLIHLLI